MLYGLLILGEDARWETFKRAEKETRRRNGLQDGPDVGRLRKLKCR
jgi:hypothetical protein